MFKMDRLGQGTWHFGENRKLYEAEIESIRYGIQNGVTLIDTAEMYGDGKSESLIGEAIKDLIGQDYILFLRYCLGMLDMMISSSVFLIL